MPSTEAKRQASRANGRKSAGRSPGPTSAAGKARSSRNAVKHGAFCSQALIRSGDGAEDVGAFEELLDGLRRAIAPRDALEELLTERVASTSWRLRRVLRYEAGATREHADEAVSEAERKRLRLADINGEDRDTVRVADAESLLAEHCERLQAIPSNGSDPRDRPPVALVRALLDHAERHGVDIGAALGIEEDWTLCEPESAWSAPLAAAIRNACAHEDHGRLWAELRRSEAVTVEDARRDAERAQLAAERATLLTALPDDEALERTIRYEAHLQRQLDRALDRLAALRA